MPKVSIIIPTYNRPDYLKRILNYYSEYKNDFEIVIADSSSPENKKNNKKIIEVISDLKIIYLDKYPETIVPWHKFSDALSRVKTKYCLFCADDDFMMPSGIKKAVDFLEKNPDFSTAHGKYILFYKGFLGKTKWKKNNEYQSIIFSDAGLRLYEHLSNYSVATFSGVHRTDLLRMIFKETARFTNDNRFGELLPSMLSLIYGKMKYLDIFYGAYEVNSKSTGVATKTILDFIKEGSYEERYIKFKNCLTEHLIKNSELDIKEAEKIIDDSMTVYLRKNYPKGYKLSLINQIKKFLARKIDFLRMWYINNTFGKLPDVPENFKNDPEIKNIINYVGF